MLAYSRVNPGLKTALVTGGTSGIGLELCRLLARDGYGLVIVARDKRELRRTAKSLSKEFGVRALAIPADLSDPGSPEQVFRQVERKGLKIDVLVNNAGFGTYGPFLDSDPATQLQMIQVNVAALTSLTRLFLPQMVRRGSGRVLNVASTAAFQPGPLMAVYYASKAYVLSFSQAIGNEVAGTGVTVTALCPGPTATGFQQRAGLAGQSKLFSVLSMMSAEQVALAGYRAMLQGRAVVIPGARNRALNIIERFLPRSTVVEYVRRMQESRKPRLG